MSEEIDVVILAKSSKNGGYCVAGIDVNSSKWVRLVSSDTNSHGALFDRDMQYRNNTFCNLLDVVRVPFLREDPSKYQPENILIDKEKRWEKIDEMSICDVLELHPPETHEFLLGNEHTYITDRRVDTVGHSLILVKVSDLIITHPRERTTKASFLYNLTAYANMSVTDPNFYNTPDETEIGDAIIIMSLPDTPFPERKYFKFIAKLFPF